MSADCHILAAKCPPYHLGLSQTLSAVEQSTIAALLRLLPAECINDIQLNTEAAAAMSTVMIKGMVDGRGLACPMPLLKTKVALRSVDNGESLYVVATDPNSQADIIAFCQHTQNMDAAAKLSLIINQATTQTSNDATSQSATNSVAAQASDTIFHFIITKTDSN